jgi:DNA invertase Pin-like site-specific DNA recombinase
MKHVALYLRVSTDRQSTENQRPECERLARQRGDPVCVYEEQASAAKRRPAFETMMADAKRGAFDVLVIWALDRFGRSMVGNLQDVVELDRIGVQLVSVRESWLDTSGPARGLLVAVFSWCAEQERARLIERTLAGMDRAKREGKQIGRPRRLGRLDVERMRSMQAAGRSVRAIAMATKCPRATVARYLASL